MQNLLLEQIKQAVENGHGIIIVEPRSDSSEYIKDIFEAAKKNDKLKDIICAPTCSLEDFKDVRPEVGQKILDNCNLAVKINRN